MTLIFQWNGKTDMVVTVGIKQWNYSGCFLTDTTHGCLSLSNKLCSASGKAVSKMIFVYVEAGHKNTSIFLGNIPRSGFATDLETLCLEIILKMFPYVLHGRIRFMKLTLAFQPPRCRDKSSHCIDVATVGH